MFRNFKSCVLKETSTYIASLRTDQGGEFTSNEFAKIKT